jgi:hypothetical protein
MSSARGLPAGVSAEVKHLSGSPPAKPHGPEKTEVLVGKIVLNKEESEHKLGLKVRLALPKLRCRPDSGSYDLAIARHLH